MLVIKNNKSGGTLICQDKLEKLLIDNKIAVHKTKTFQKSKDRGILLNTRKDVDLFIEKLGKEVQGHPVEFIPAMKPTVSVVGLAKK